MAISSDLSLEIDEETAQLIYDELREKDKQLSVVKFVKWDNVQELLESEALTADNLALCLEKSNTQKKT